MSQVHFRESVLNNEAENAEKCLFMLMERAKKA
jgi:hypothetical protein